MQVKPFYLTFFFILCALFCLSPAATVHTNIQALIIDEASPPTFLSLAAASESELLADESKRKKAEALKNKGNDLMTKGQIDEALKYYRQAIEVDPSYANPYNNIGMILEKKGQHDNAAIYYKKAIEKDGTIFQPYLNLAFISFEKGKNTEAENSAEKPLNSI